MNVLLAFLLIASGNLAPRFKDRPQGFSPLGTCTSARRPLPKRAVERQLCGGRFLHSENEMPDFLTVTEYKGAATLEEIERARDYYAERYGEDEYGEIENIMVDGQLAYGWADTEGETDMGYTAVVPYDDKDVTFSVEFSVHHKDIANLDYIKKTVLSFSILDDVSTSSNTTFLALLFLVIAGVTIKMVLKKMRG